jgi:predicted dehydrogenase
MPSMKSKKFLIVGLGSMGKRRIRNLHFHGQHQIIGYDISSNRRHEARQKYQIETVDDLKKIAKESFDVMIISTPPDQHGDYIRIALKLKKHFFVEHPTSDDGYKDIFSAQKRFISGREKKSTVMAPSCTMRYYLPVKMIKNILDQGKIGKILAFQYHAGQYLPDWHTYEDYRQVYFSKKATGACREIFPFELIWLNWVFNSKVKEVSGYTSKVSDLEMSADDIILANLKYKNGILGNVIIDAISRKPYQTLRILGSEGVLDWERFDFVIKLYQAKQNKNKIIAIPKGHPETGYINEEEMYYDEIKAFLDAVDKKNKYPHTFADSLELLKILYALEKSHRYGKKVKL